MKDEGQKKVGLEEWNREKRGHEDDLDDCQCDCRQSQYDCQYDCRLEEDESRYDYRYEYRYYLNGCPWEKEEEEEEEEEEHKFENKPTCLTRVYHEVFGIYRLLLPTSNPL